MHVLHPTDLSDALDARANGATPIAGGTDFMVEVNFGHRKPDDIVSLRRVEALKEIDGHRIGSGVTWKHLESEGPRALAQSARTVGSPQIRAAGTIGGNLATASPAGDGHPYLAAVDASIEVASSQGSRILKWDEFFIGVKRTAMTETELVTSVLLPERQPERQEFAKIGIRNAMVIATVCVVVTRDTDGDTRVALGSVAPTPMRAYGAEQMISSISQPSESDLAEFQRLVAEEVSPITDHRSTEGYRRHGAGVLARRLLERCLR